MTPADANARPPVVFHLEGRNIQSVNAFYREIGAAVNGPGGYFGRNLDALADCLRGGFGTPEEEPFEFEWRDSALSRRSLGDRFLDGVADVFTDAGVRLRLR